MKKVVGRLTRIADRYQYTEVKMPEVVDQRVNASSLHGFRVIDLSSENLVTPGHLSPEG